jgi:hypothetical protein
LYVFKAFPHSLILFRVKVMVMVMVRIRVRIRVRFRVKVGVRIRGLERTLISEYPKIGP